MDSTGREVPIVEDDQGEGYEDPINPLESKLERMLRKKEKYERRKRTFKEQR